MSRSYDDRQLEKPLRLCLTCGRAFYMADVICAWCGDGWRTVQESRSFGIRESRLDVNKVEMFDP